MNLDISAVLQEVFEIPTSSVIETSFAGKLTFTVRLPERLYVKVQRHLKKQKTRRSPFWGSPLDEALRVWVVDGEAALIVRGRDELVAWLSVVCFDAEEGIQRHVHPRLSPDFPPDF